MKLQQKSKADIPKHKLLWQWKWFSLCGWRDESKQMKWDFVALGSHDAGSSATVGEVGVVCAV